MNPKKFITLIAGVCVIDSVGAGTPQDKKTYDGNSFDLTIALYANGSTPGYRIDLNYARWMNQNLGITASIGYARYFLEDYLPSAQVNDRTGRVFNRDDDKLMPAPYVAVGPALRIPVLHLGKERDWILGWECRPSFTLTIPNQQFYYSHIEPGNDLTGTVTSIRARNSSGQWNYLQLVNRIYVENTGVILSLGYGISNEQPFSHIRNIRFEGQNVSAATPGRKPTHTVTLSIGYAF